MASDKVITITEKQLYKSDVSLDDITAFFQEDGRSQRPTKNEERWVF